MTTTTTTKTLAELTTDDWHEPDGSIVSTAPISGRQPVVVIAA